MCTFVINFGFAGGRIDLKGKLRAEGRAALGFSSGDAGCPLGGSRAVGRESPDGLS